MKAMFRMLYMLMQKKGRYRFKKNRKGAYGHMIGIFYNHYGKDTQYTYGHDKKRKWFKPAFYDAVESHSRNAVKLWLILNLSEFQEHYILDKKKGWVDKRF